MGEYLLQLEVIALVSSQNTPSVADVGGDILHSFFMILKDMSPLPCLDLSTVA